MSSDNESVKSNASVKKFTVRSASITRRSRTKSIDSLRGINNEMEMLMNDENENGADKTVKLSEQMEGLSDDDGVSRVTNEKLFALMTQMNKTQETILNSQFTKKEGVALKKAVDKKFEVINIELKAHSTKFTVIEERMSQFETKLALAKYEQELSKQQALKNNISIVGCPKYDDENVTETVIKIFKAFGVHFKPTDFSGVYRSMGKKPSFTSIIVKFKDFEKKLAALNSKAKKPIKMSDVFGASQSNAQIYLNNHVTPFFGRLLSVGRQAVKDERIHSCWIGTGGCLIKLDETSKPITIRSLDDLDAVAIRGKPANVYKRGKPDHASSPSEKTSKKNKE